MQLESHMNNEEPQINAIIARLKLQLDEWIFILLLLLSLGGVGITKFSPSEGYRYWIVMIFVFAIFAIITGWLEKKKQEESFKALFLEQCFHWGGCLLVVGAMFTLTHSEHLDPTNTDLIFLLLLSLATFLDGQRVGWRFCLLGVFLGGSAVIISHVDNYMWVETLLAIAIGAGSFAGEHWYNKFTAK